MLFIVIFAFMGASSGAAFTASLNRGNRRQSVRADILGMYTYPTKRSDSSIENSLYTIKCPPYQIPNIDGSCSVPDIRQNVFVYGSPVEEEEKQPLPKIPKPKIEYNVVVIRSKERGEDTDPIIVPPPREKTVVLVLKKERDDGAKKVIEVESDNPNPEVFFVDYRDGQNFDLPGGIDLRTALQYSTSDSGDVQSTEEPEPREITFEPRAPSSQSEEEPRPSKTKITRRYPLPRQRYSEPGSREPANGHLSDENDTSLQAPTISNRTTSYRPSSQISSKEKMTAVWKRVKSYENNESKIQFKSLIDSVFD